MWYQILGGCDILLGFSLLAAVMLPAWGHVEITDLHVQASLTYSFGNRADQNLTSHQRALSEHLNQKDSDGGRVQTISFDSDADMPSGEISPGLYLAMRSSRSPDDPKAGYVTLALEVAAFGPKGSVAKITLRPDHSFAGAPEVVPARPTSRMGVNEKYVHIYTRTFKLPLAAESGPNGMNNIQLPIDLGTLLVEGGGKVRERFKVLSVSATEPPGSPE